MVNDGFSQSLTKSEVGENFKSRESKSHSPKRGSYLVTIFISLASTILGIFIYDRFFVPKIAVFDLPGYVIGLRNLYLSKQISDEELRRKIDEAISIVQAHTPNYVVFSSDVVLGRNKKIKVIPTPPLPAGSQKPIEELMKDYFKREGTKEYFNGSAR